MRKTQKILTIVISAILTLSIIAMMPISTAQTATTLPTNAFIAVSPNPAGAGQQVTLEMWLLQPNPSSSGVLGGRWTGLTVQITKPDGKTSTLGPYTANDAAFAVTNYTPDSTGNYTFLFTFPGQTVTVNNMTYYYSPSNSTATLVVQQEPAASYSSPALPTEYWIRPINSQNTWSSISGNWLAQGTALFGSSNKDISGNFNAYSQAPNTAHILWSKQLMAGGLIGGEFGDTTTSNYYTGKSYWSAFSPPIIINGVLYYNAPLGQMITQRGFYAVNLRTGQTLWYQNSTNTPIAGSSFTATLYPGITLGQIYNYESPNQNGAFPYLWYTSASPWKMYDATTGDILLNIANATSGTFVQGPNGELLEYIKGSNYLALWNSSLCIGTLANYSSNIRSLGTYLWTYNFPIGATINWANGIQYNVTTTAPGSISNVNSGVILTNNMPSNTLTATWSGFSAATGSLLWTQNISLPSGPFSTTIGYQLGPMVNGTFTFYDAFAETWYAYNANTGAKIWGPSEPDPNPWGSEAYASFQAQIAYNTLFAVTPGDTRALDINTGNVLWTFKGIDSGTDFPGFSSYPAVFETFSIADGKLYIQTGDSHGNPLFKGAQLYCVNATTGDLIWNINDFGPAKSTAPISDGILVAFNGYDNQIYAYGMGPSKTTISAPQVGVTTATPITITGSVTDISAGVSQDAIAKNFPNGLPCVSDASMTQFMEAVYMQQTMPTNLTGVPITINVIDSNGNYRTIGTTVSNAYGTYSFTWTPDISGDYTVIANFAGTGAYYGSNAATAFHASEPAATSTAQPAQAPNAADLYLLPGIIGIIIAIVIGFAATVLILRKRP
jgi:hypothetical protein